MMGRKVGILILITIGVVLTLTALGNAACYEIRDANGNDLHFGDRGKFLEVAGDAPFGCVNHGGDDRHCIGFMDCSVEGGEEDLESGAITGGEKVFDGCTYDLEVFTDGYDAEGEEIVFSTGVYTNIAEGANECSCSLLGVEEDSGTATGGITLLDGEIIGCDDYIGSEENGCSDGGNDLWEREGGFENIGRQCVYGGVPSGSPGFGFCGEGGPICALGGGPSCSEEDCHYKNDCTTSYYDEEDAPYYSVEKLSERKYFEELEVKTRIFLDPDYVDNSMKVGDGEGVNREINPRLTGMSPFDDVICEARVEVSGNDNCNPLIKNLELEGKIVAVRYNMFGDEIEEEEVIVDGGVLSYVDNITDDYDGKDHYIYQWKIPGWTNQMMGWGGNTERVEKLIDIVSLGGGARCDVEAESDGVKVVDVEGRREHVSLCVGIHGPDGSTKNEAGIPVYDRAEIKVVHKRFYDSNMKGRQVVNGAFVDRFHGFNEIDPFKFTKKKFSFYADLEEKFSFGDSKGERIGIAAKPGSCGSARLNFLYTNIPGLAGFTYRGSKGVLLEPLASTHTAIHETGHALGRLHDEYHYLGPWGTFQMNLLGAGMNCEYIGTPYWRRYGDQNREGCVTPSFKRPSKNSIMNNLVGEEYQDKFNVVSCAYIYGAIVRGPVDDLDRNDFFDNANSCCSMGTAKSGTGFDYPVGCP
jgi:hypothetical protein